MPDSLSQSDRDAIQACLSAGHKIEAIRIYRTATRAGLAEAKAAVEAMESGVASVAPAASTSLDEFSNPIRTLLFAGQKIQAIKAYREANGASLRDAKEAVEAMEAELRASSPNRFSPPSGKGGCLPMLMLWSLPVATAFAWLYR